VSFFENICLASVIAGRTWERINGCVPPPLGAKPPNASAEREVGGTAEILDPYVQRKALATGQCEAPLPIWAFSLSLGGREATRCAARGGAGPAPRDARASAAAASPHFKRTGSDVSRGGPSGPDTARASRRRAGRAKRPCRPCCG